MMTSSVADLAPWTFANGHSDASHPASGYTPGNSGYVAGGGATGLQFGEEDEEALEFNNAEHPPDLLLAMGNLRRQNQFCDAVLRVGEREERVHRAVLAAASPVLFELFERSADTHHSQSTVLHTTSMYKLKDVSCTGFSYLLDYMYSGRLRVCAAHVGEVYRTAKVLRMEQAALSCAAFLAERLTPSNCLGMRMFAEDATFRGRIDEFIQGHVEDAINSKTFFGLPELKVEIVGAEEAMENGGSERQLFGLVLDWARDSLDTASPKLQLLTEEVNVLYLNAENHLQDCKDVDDSRMSDDDVVVDYKKHSRRRPKKPTLSPKQSKQQHSVLGASNGAAGNGSAAAHPMPVHIFSIDPEGGVVEKEWTIIATRKQKGGHSYMGLGVLAGQMVAISLHLRYPVSTPSSPLPPGLASPDTENGERCATLQPLKPMASYRCAFGVCVWGENFVVCGGYDRGECLKSVEMYSPSKGAWSTLPDMLSPRARFGAASLGGYLYAIAGSDGSRDLNSTHRFSFQTQKWEAAASLSTARSAVGVAELEGHLYCVGGSDGQRSLKLCEKFHPDKNQWTVTAPLNTARSQAAVCAFGGGLVAVGGTDFWNCTNTVEMYAPASNTWTYLTSLALLRRGAGIDILDNKLWVVGGSDGVSSLRSTEVYDPHSGSWSAGPALNVPRANVSLVALRGNLYAAGGFSGKKFLNTLEVLAADSPEWCLCQPARRSAKKRGGSADSSGDDLHCSTPATTVTDSEASGSDQEVSSADENRIR